MFDDPDLVLCSHAVHCKLEKCNHRMPHYPDHLDPCTEFSDCSAVGGESVVCSHSRYLGYLDEAQGEINIPNEAFRLRKARNGNNKGI